MTSLVFLQPFLPAALLISPGGLLTLLLLTLLILVGVGFPLLIFVLALWEKQQLYTWSRLASGDLSLELADKFKWIVEEARSHGFELVGRFRTRNSNLYETYLSVLVSSDLRTGLVVNHGFGYRYRLVTLLPQGKMVATTDVAASTDLSGLVVEKQVPRVSFPVVLNCHLERLAQLPEMVVLIDPESFAEDWLEHEKHRVNLLVEKGYARFVHPPETWVYTVKGAWGLVKGMGKTISGGDRDVEWAKSKAREFTPRSR